ncbi:MAG: hypothetical protein ACPGVO_23140 [Spirulinaceae cyanobacterium]
MLRYILYGRQVQSNRAIADLLPSPAHHDQIDIELVFAARPDWQDNWTEAAPWRTSRRQQLQVWRSPHPDRPQRFWWRYQDGCSFWIEHSSPTRIWLTWPHNLTPEDAITYLLGPVLAFVVRLDGQVSLHASGVAFSQGAVLFLGPAGAGKSTTAALLARQGCPVLTDDVVVLHPQEESGFTVSPGYPRLRLWPRSAELLYGDRQALPRLVPSHPTWDKQYLDLRQPGLDFAQHPLPLVQIYCLGRRSPTGPSRITDLSSQAAWRQLIANTSVNYLLDRQLRQQEFAVMGRLVQQVACSNLAVTQEPRQWAQLQPQLSRHISQG